VQGNLANSYQKLGRREEALSMRQEVYSSHLKLNGREHGDTLLEANNYANCLLNLERFEAAKPLLRKTIPIARRVLGASHETTLRIMWNYARALYSDTDATLDDLREAVTTLEEMEPAARRVLGGAHPFVLSIERSLRASRAALLGRGAGKRVVFVER
jgi:tetratricopeptide (TPR) repeat protein